jgi:hypothetical protein
MIWLFLGHYQGGAKYLWEMMICKIIIIIIIIIIINNNDDDNDNAEYLDTNYKGDQFVNIVKNHDSTQPNMNSIIKLAAKITEDLSQLNGTNDAKQVGIQHTKAKLGEVLEKNWKNKAMHGQCLCNIDRHLISGEDTFLWLTKGDLKAESESEIVATQDQVLQMKYYATKILNMETDSKCRLCHQFDETIDIMSACPLLAKEQYYITVYKKT